ncbi:MAG: YdcF family protein [Nitrosomonadales bacterium]|nr:YdcF family protein [Nitrosomonadales bacterium]
MSWLLTNLVSKFLLPPLCLLLLAGWGLLVWRSRPVLARVLLTFSFSLLWLASTPYFAKGAMRWLEGPLVAVDTAKQPAEAIVVLGSGQYFHAPEYGGNTVSREALERLRYGARLLRQTNKPILVTGGSPEGDYLSEAAQMKTVLEEDFNVPVRWTEDNSDNTMENARLSYAILQQAGIKRIYLVTHAWHMPRSVEVFQRAGFEVIPAPTGFSTRYETNLLSFLPNGEAMYLSSIFAHEMIGQAWYRLKSGFAD